VLNSKHGSVLEHANYSFVLANVSRVFTHELVRHRVGTAFSQESMRFVRLDDIGFEEPDIFPDTPEGRHLRGDAKILMRQIERFQIDAARVNGLDDPGVDFARKKTVTSAMRRYAPDGLSTHIGFTANVRALRWLCQQRTEPSAEVEIRKVFNLVGQTMCIEEPELFQDFIVDEDGAWVPANRKV
jgi:thymidylate synthase (FAD)